MPLCGINLRPGLVDMSNRYFDPDGAMSGKGKKKKVSEDCPSNKGWIDCLQRITKSSNLLCWNPQRIMFYQHKSNHFCVYFREEIIIFNVIFKSKSNSKSKLLIRLSLFTDRLARVKGVQTHL